MATKIEDRMRKTEERHAELRRVRAKRMKNLDNWIDEAKKEAKRIDKGVQVMFGASK